MRSDQLTLWLLVLALLAAWLGVEAYMRPEPLFSPTLRIEAVQ